MTVYIYIYIYIKEVNMTVFTKTSQRKRQF